MNTHNSFIFLFETNFFLILLRKIKKLLLLIWNFLAIQNQKQTIILLDLENFFC